MSTLNRKLRRELGHAWGRLLAVASIIAVGVGCYIEMSSAHTNLTEAKSRYYVQCRMADFSIELKKAPVSELAVIANFPEVTDIRTRIQFFATVDLPNA